MSDKTAGQIYWALISAVFILLGLIIFERFKQREEPTTLAQIRKDCEKVDPSIIQTLNKLQDYICKEVAK